MIEITTETEDRQQDFHLCRAENPGARLTKLEYSTEAPQELMICLSLSMYEVVLISVPMLCLRTELYANNTYWVQFVMVLPVFGQEQARRENFGDRGSV